MEPSSGNPYNPNTSAESPIPPTSKAAVAGLVLGFLSLVFSCLAGLPGIIVSIIALVKINKSEGQLKGTGLAVVGLILSVVLSTVTFVFGVLIGMLLPAIQQAREAAERTMMENQARQQAVAEPDHSPIEPKAVKQAPEKPTQ